MNWIWLNETDKDFAEFERAFSYNGGEAQLFVSADYRYAAYLNGEMVSCGQYADTPEYKCVNAHNITPYLKKGENLLRIVAWHLGGDFSVCRAMTPAIAYEIVVEGKVIAQSDKKTRCRASSRYVDTDRVVTPQLGYGFDYDFTAKERKWKKSVKVHTNFAEAPRPIPQTIVDGLCVSKIVAQGVFTYRKEFKKETAAVRMQRAWLSAMRFQELTGKERMANDCLYQPLTFSAKGGDGVYVVADMGRETCGYLGFSVTVKKPCKMLLGWGEHLSDLRVRTSVGGRNFAMEISLKAGENALDDYLMRLGCRYICLFVEGKEATLSRLGIREVRYPFALPQKNFGDRLWNDIYEAGRRTLMLSAHEHYEDCPWREQALYGMDSRNQMLFGYGAFGEVRLPRASLRMLAHSMQSNGLIALTPPAKMAITIPSFTAYWLIAIGENAEVHYDEGFVKEMLPYAEKALLALLGQEKEWGLSLFTAPEYWNFHEWSDGLDGGEIWRKEPIEEEGDAGLTALTIAAANKIAVLEQRVGNVGMANKLYTVADRLTGTLEKYYSAERGLYASYIKKGEKHGFHAYTQAVLMFAGAVSQKRAERLCAALKEPKKYALVPITFAALQMKYEAIITYGKDFNYCVNEIVDIFSKMLYSGATSYWETANGEADFGDAGSLCHGWSAVACWLFDKYLTNRK